MDCPILEAPEMTSEQYRAMFSECTKVDVDKVIESFAGLKDSGLIEMLEQAKRDILMKR